MAQNRLTKEDRQNKQRIIIAILISLIGHGLFLIFGLSFQHEKKRDDKVVVMTVKLADADCFGDQSPKQSASASQNKKSASHSTSAPKQSAAQKGKNTPKTQKQKEAPKEKANEGEKENVSSGPEAVRLQEDLIKQVTEQQGKAKQAAENDFFEKSGGAKSQDNLPDIGDLDTLFGGLSSGEGNTGGATDTHGSSGSGSDKNITWGGGGNRRLKYSAPIKVPDEVAASGFKFTIQIRFTVLADGHIGSAQIIKSSGNTQWDDDIKQQFSKWTFESSANGSAVGSISINIGY